MDKQEQQSPKQQKINMRFIEPYLQTKVSLLLVDRKFSLAVELKDDAAQKSNEAMGLATIQIANLLYSHMFQYLRTYGNKMSCINESKKQTNNSNQQMKN